MGGNSFSHFEEEQISPYRWHEREKGKVGLPSATTDVGGKSHFADRVDVSAAIGVTGPWPWGHSMPRAPEGEATRQVLGLEDERRVPHGHQPLHAIPSTAEPVLVHSGDDSQHLPAPEAELVWSRRSVVTERADGPAGSQRNGLG